MTDPLSAPCPTCFARRGQRCTQATDGGRRPVEWTHYSREYEADQTKGEDR